MAVISNVYFVMIMIPEIRKRKRSLQFMGHYKIIWSSIFGIIERLFSLVFLLYRYCRIFFKNFLISFLTVCFDECAKTQDGSANFEMNLMDIDSEHHGIDESKYCAVIRMPSSEFQRICKVLSSIGDTGIFLGI